MYLYVCKVDRVLLEEAYELLEVLLRWKIVTAVRPNRLQNYKHRG